MYAVLRVEHDVCGVLPELNVLCDLCFLRKEKCCSSALKMEYDFPVVVEDYDKTDEVQIWETELHDFMVWYIVPGKDYLTSVCHRYSICMLNVGLFKGHGV